MEGNICHINPMSAIPTTPVARVLDAMVRHPILTAIVAIPYFAVTVHFHGDVSDLCHLVRANIGNAPYNLSITIACITLLATASWHVVQNIRRSRRKFVRIAYWIVTSALITLAYQTLFVLNSEAAHFPQYAILVFPVFAFARRYGETVLWIALLGAVDELCQYVVGYSLYFDFNDIILDVLGGGIGVVFIFACTDHRSGIVQAASYSIRSRLLSPAYITLALVLLVTLTLITTGVIALFADESSGGAAFIFSRVPAPTQVWHDTDWGKTYHILHPGYGTIIILLLIGIYTGLDYAANTNATCNTTTSQPRDLAIDVRHNDQ